MTPKIRLKWFSFYVGVWFMICLIMISDAFAIPGIELHIQGQEPQLYQIENKEHPEYVFTWDECLAVLERIKEDMIKETPDIEDALEAGYVTVKCVDLSYDQLQELEAQKNANND